MRVVAIPLSGLKVFQRLRKKRYEVVLSLSDELRMR